MTIAAYENAKAALALEAKETKEGSGIKIVENLSPTSFKPVITQNTDIVVNYNKSRSNFSKFSIQEKSIQELPHEEIDDNKSKSNSESSEKSEGKILKKLIKLSRIHGSIYIKHNSIVKKLNNKSIYFISYLKFQFNLIYFIYYEYILNKFYKYIHINLFFYFTLISY